MENNPPAAGRGRPKGSPNKMQAAIKEMIVQALENKGGVEYLEKQADDNPTAFLTLVGKVLPLQVDANVAANVVTEVRHVIVDGPGD